jgi:endonuclease/exonuclease/phosphatase family metal-dependent hydrolase
MNPSEQRKAMCQTIAETAASKHSLVFCGDTNLNPTNHAIAPIDALLTPVFAKDELLTSFNLNHKDLVNFPGYATAVVDLMYVSDDIRVIAHSAPADDSADVSDHLPLVATLEIA